MLGGVTRTLPVDDELRQFSQVVLGGQAVQVCREDLRVDGGQVAGIGSPGMGEAGQ